MPMGSRVYKTHQTQGEFSEVLFVTSTKEYMGWAYTKYLEELQYEFPVTGVFGASQTPNPVDAAQYIIWKNNVQYNLCGEGCVAFLFGETIETFLEKWEAKPVSYFHQVFQGGKARTTGIGDLMDMVDVYGAETQSLRNLIYDAVSNGSLISPGILRDLVDEWCVIVGCKISGVMGELKPSGIPHWIVLDRVIPDGINNGMVEIYNPFPDRVQRYSWKEFLASIGTPYGIGIKRVR